MTRPDDRISANAVERALGIDDVVVEVLPAQKREMSSDFRLRFALLQWLWAASNIRRRDSTTRQTCSKFYSYAIPFQDTGLRIHYDHNSKVYSEVYILNGWNVGFDLNKGKTFGYSVGFTPSPKFSVFANYLGGPEQPDNNTNWRHLGDFQVFINPTTRFRTMTNIDVGYEKDALAGGANAKWAGVAEVLRYRLTERFDPSLRLEWYHDPDGFSTGVVQKNLVGFTATLDSFLGKGDNDKILVRPEIRYDHSDANFFSHDSTAGLTRKYQATVGINLVYYF